jgi:hypothetical protein
MFRRTAEVLTILAIPTFVACGYWAEKANGTGDTYLGPEVSRGRTTGSSRAATTYDGHFWRICVYGATFWGVF